MILTLAPIKRPPAPGRTAHCLQLHRRKPPTPDAHRVSPTRMQAATSDGASPLGPVKFVPVGGAGGCLAAVKISSPVAEQSDRLPIIFGHGLTRCKEHQAKYCDKAMLDERVVVVYDARGHGESSGWEDSPPEVFTWEEQAGDVFAVADAFGLTTFVVGGNSMTSAAAVYAALRCNPRVAGFVFCRLPTAWDTRKARQGSLLKAAVSGEGSTPSNVLAGAAMSDLPEPKALEGQLPSVPVLLLSTHDDPVHPVATPETMAQLFPSATLVICNNGKDSIKREFPGIIRDFMCKIDGGTHVSGT